MSTLPTGTVTFVFTDIEGSTRLVQRLGDRHREVLETHARLLRRIVAEEGGIEVGERGDGFFFVFVDPNEAAGAAVRVQRSLAEHPWPPEGTIRVRIGIHTGEGVLGGDNYMGLEVHRAARIGNAGHGGQVILSEATAALLRKNLPKDLGLIELGCHQLKDLPEGEQLFQLRISGLPSDFPPPRTLGYTNINLPHSPGSDHRSGARRSHGTLLAESASGRGGSFIIASGILGEAQNSARVGQLRTDPLRGKSGW